MTDFAPTSYNFYFVKVISRFYSVKEFTENLVKLRWVRNLKKTWYKWPINPDGNSSHGFVLLSFSRENRLGNFWEFKSNYSTYNIGRCLKRTGFPDFWILGIQKSHSIATANLNKREWLVTNTTTASKYIPKRLRISINQNSPFSDQNLLSKSTSKYECCEVIFTS